MKRWMVLNICISRKFLSDSPAAGVGLADFEGGGTVLSLYLDLEN